jgi:hypothetical protein
MLSHAVDLFQGSWRYATGLGHFLSETIDREDAQRLLREQLARREESFLRVLELGIYERAEPLPATAAACWVSV